MLTLIRGGAEQGMSNIMKGVGSLNDTKGNIDTYKVNVVTTWSGDDCKAFEQEIVMRVIPMTIDFVNSLMNLNTNLAGAIEVIDRADSACKGIADQMKGVFSEI